VTAAAESRDEARRLNRAIDARLLAPGGVGAEGLLRVAGTREAARLAERVRRRATLLGKARRGPREAMLRARDHLILQLYAGAAPAGWHVAWSDGSVGRRAGDGRAGIGGLVLGPRDRGVLVEISAPAAPHDPLSVELAAMTAVLHAALDLGAQRLRLYTDCDALVALWLRHRDDSRLTGLQGLALWLRRFELRSVPRQHNPVAHRLARRAMGGGHPRSGLGAGA
jgi:ribonuclease HI